MRVVSGKMIHIILDYLKKYHNRETKHKNILFRKILFFRACTLVLMDMQFTFFYENNRDIDGMKNNMYFFGC